VRNGVFGQLTSSDAAIGRCLGCGVERLDEAHCYEDSLYAGAHYRQLLGEGTDADSFFAEHDILQLQNLSALWPDSLRGQVIADVGCAAGSFLDHVAGLAAETIAVEPCIGYHESLRARGYSVFPYAADAATSLGRRVDIATSFSCIEHVRDPRSFLAEIGTMLKPTGQLLVSTPNRADILMDLLPNDYPSFFYRSVHRWYFDVTSFARCAELAGLRVVKSRVVHRFGLSNTLTWLRDRRPVGRSLLPHLDSPLVDRFWQSYLEQVGCGDYCYFWLTPAG
jgi:2-polyprenyl-3-methyl-5-hydroxy-6-metoxy-1,4-benzoquinol methylase